MGNYRLAPEAKADLERIWIYGLEHWGLEAADKYYTAFFDHFEQLAMQPNLYPATDIREGYRRSVCGTDSVYYRIEGEAPDHGNYRTAGRRGLFVTQAIVTMNI